MNLILLIISLCLIGGCFVIPFGLAIINMGTLSYVYKYEEKILKELDRINYKLTDFYDGKTFLIDKIFPSFSSDINILFCSISVFIKVLKKYRPFNMKKTLTYFNQKGLIVPMTEEEIIEKEAKKRKEFEEKDKEIKKKQVITEDLNRIYSKEKVETRELSTEKVKEQLKVTKELDNSDAALVLKIQTLLVKLKKINPKAYETFNMEYEQLAKTGKLSNFMLKDFLARLLVSFDCDIRDASLLINYLDYLIASYENKTPINNQIAELSFKKLENIAKEIINNSNIYSREDKIIIYKKLSLLYLYLIYENKYINIDAIRNSCFNTDALLYGAILNIYELREQNIIEDNLLFDINEKYDLESVLKLIREMKFIRKENTYIKKRQADIAI